MTGQMCWLSASGSEQKILHLRFQSDRPWQPYNTLPHLAIVNYNLPGGSEGLATFHSLHKAGWQLITTQDAHIFKTSPPAPSRPELTRSPNRAILRSIRRAVGKI
jgi:hypothetical protein